MLLIFSLFSTDENVVVNIQVHFCCILYSSTYQREGAVQVEIELWAVIADRRRSPQDLYRRGILNAAGLLCLLKWCHCVVHTEMTFRLMLLMTLSPHDRTFTAGMNELLLSNIAVVVWELVNLFRPSRTVRRTYFLQIELIWEDRPPC